MRPFVKSWEGWDMNSEWTNHSLFDVIEMISGGTPKTTVPEYWDGDIPWLTVADFNLGYRWVNSTAKHISEKGVSESATTVLNRGDIIISARGTVGAMAQLSKPMAFNQSCYGVRGLAHKSDTDFLYYLLRNVVSEMKRIAHGGVFDTITKDTFKQLGICLPSLPEQLKISELLGSLDDRIALLRETNTTLEAIAQALFKSWFIDFDPVKAKQRGEEPQGMDAETAALFPDAFVESEVGAIPKGWAVIRMGEKVSPKKGKNITRGTIIPGEVPVVAGGLNPAYYHNIHNVAAPVVTISASGANAGYVRLYQENIWASDCSYISKQQTPHVYSMYLFLKCRQNEIIGMQQGAAQPHVYPKDLMRLVFFNAPDTLWDKFEMLISSFFEQMRVNSKQISCLASMRDALLPRLISGKLRLPEAEEIVKDALG